MALYVLQKRTSHFFFLILGVVSLSSCGDNMKNNKDLQQAFQFHKEAVKVRQAAKEKMTLLQANEDSLFLATYGEDLQIISRSLNAWDEQLVEVPGFEEEHDHSDHDHSDHDHSGHDHHHDEAPELTPEQHLGVQQHLLKEIKAIVERIENLKE